MEGSPTLLPAILLLGISGVGKTRVANRLESHHRWIHVNADDGGGFVPIGLGHEWNCLHKRLDAPPLAEAVHNRAVENGAAGAVVSLPSTCVLSIDEVRSAEQSGLQTVVLWGEWEFCKNARQRRDGQDDSKSDEHKYEQRNGRAFEAYGGYEFRDFRVDVFHPDGHHVPAEETAMAILRRAAI